MPAEVLRVPDREPGRVPAEVLRVPDREPAEQEPDKEPAGAVRVHKAAEEPDCFRNPYLISPFNIKTKKFHISFNHKLAHYFNKINRFCVFSGYNSVICV